VKKTRALSRRQFLLLGTGGAIGLMGMNILSACSSQAPGAPAKTGGAAPAAPAKAATITIWRASDYVATTNPGLKARWDEVGAANNITVNFDEKTGTWKDQLVAAVQAGTPPDVAQANDADAQFWRTQNQAVDVTDVVNNFKDKEGGFWEHVATACALKGQWHSTPLAVNARMIHARQDLLDQANGGKWPDNWDDFTRVSKAVNKPPAFYAYGYTMGRDNDTLDHFVPLLWSLGGKIQNDDGTFAITPKDEAALEALRLTQKWFLEDKIIPPGAVNWASGDNNNNYQGEQIAWTNNAASIYVWCQKNKPDLAEKTMLYGFPKGKAGTFGQVIDVWAQTIFKASKNQEAAKTIVAGLIEPAWYLKYIEDTQKGRFISLYKNHMDRPMWKEGKLREYGQVAKTGRILSYSAEPLSPFAQMYNDYLVGDLVQALCIRKETPENALANFVDAAKAIYAKYKT
jgi:ABC-type glycerol-3-phosphate transport system substrate-binding protein